jgi:hypothetical protein
MLTPNPPYPYKIVVFAGRSADPVQVDAAVVLLLSLRRRAGSKPAHVVERLAGRPAAGARAGQPGNAGVAAAVNGAVHVPAGGHVHDPQLGLLVAALGELVGEQLPFGVRLPGIQRGDAGRVDRHRVDQDAFGRASSGSGEQHGVIRVRGAPEEELAVTAPGRRADRACPHELGDPPCQRVAAWQCRGMPGEQRVLRRQPRARLGGLRVLEPPVRIPYHAAGDLLGDLQPAGGGEVQFGHARNPSGARTRSSFPPCGDPCGRQHAL